MSPTPVLVVHGISNRSATAFAQTVSELQSAIGSAYALFDFVWGDLGGVSAGLADTLPGLWPAIGTSHRHETRAGAQTAAADIIVAQVISGRPASQSPGFDVRSDQALQQQIRHAVATTDWVKDLEDVESLVAVGDLVREALQEAAAAVAFTKKPNLGAAFGGQGDVEVRAGIGNVVDRIVGRVDHLIGKLTAGLGGTVNQLVRGKLAVPIALTLGDIVGYHQNRRQIQERLFARIDQMANGFGTRERPIDVMAHSLGGLLVLDAALGSEVDDRRLHVRKLVTFGSQPAFFHVMSPRKGLPPYDSASARVRLPEGSIGSWTNLWHPLDVLAFLAGSVFALPDGSAPVDLEVGTPGSDIIERRGWLHSVYWTSPLLWQQWRGS